MRANFSPAGGAGPLGVIPRVAEICDDGGRANYTMPGNADGVSIHP